MLVDPLIVFFDQSGRVQEDEGMVPKRNDLIGSRSVEGSLIPRSGAMRKGGRST